MAAKKSSRAHPSDGKPLPVAPPGEDGARPEMPTLIDEVELEVARLASARRSSSPPALPPQIAGNPRSEHDIDVVWAPDSGPADPEEAFSKYVRLLGSFKRVPMITVPFEQLPSLSLDNRMGFLVALIDGVSSIETLIDIAGMPPREVLHALVTLRDLGILTLRD